MQIIVFAVIGFFLLTGGVFIMNSSKKTSSPTPPATVISQSVPLPQETDVVRTFFNLIQERRISEAVIMMNESIIKDDSQKQAWGVQFNAINSVRLLEITPSLPDEWQNNKHTYKVVLDMTMDPASANAVIPYYGFNDGQNTRWVEIEKFGDKWKINSLATGQ